MPGLEDRHGADGRVPLVARAAKAPEELDAPGVAAGDVGGELFQQAQALARRAGDNRWSFGDIQALGAARSRGRLTSRGGEEVADVRDHPIVAGLDRLILAQPVDAAAHDGELGADAVDQFLQGPGGGIRLRRRARVQRAVDGREQRPELGLAYQAKS